MKQSTPGTPSSIGTEASYQKGKYFICSIGFINWNCFIVFSIPSYEDFEQYSKQQVKEWVVGIGVRSGEVLDYEKYADKLYHARFDGAALLMLDSPKDELKVYIEAPGHLAKVIGYLKTIKETKGSGM